MKQGILVSQILQSQKPDPRRRQVIQFDQDVHVYGTRWMTSFFYAPLYDLSPLFIFENMAILFLLLFFHAQNLDKNFFLTLFF